VVEEGQMSRGDLFLYRWLAIFATMLVLLFPLLLCFAWYGYGFTNSKLFYCMGATAVLGLIGAIITVCAIYGNWENFKHNERGGLGLALFGFYILLFAMAFLFVLALGAWFFHEKTINNLDSLIERREEWDSRYKGYSLGHAENDIDVYFKAAGYFCGLVGFVILLATPYYMKLANRLLVLHVFL
jgi:hypothetical protein